MTLTWVFVLLAIGLFILLMEVFIPSHGLLSVAGVGALGTSLFFGFKFGMGIGFLVLGLVVVLLPIEIIIGVKLFPSTPLGRRMMLPARRKTTDEDRAGDVDLSEYVGKEGVTVTMCRPAGMAEVGGRRVDVVAEGMVIDANRPVTVLRVDGNRVVIREN